MFKATILLAIAASATGFQLGSSFTPRMGATQARAGRSVGPTMAAVPCGINGFGRIGRLVARIMIKVFALYTSGAFLSPRDYCPTPSIFQNET